MYCRYRTPSTQTAVVISGLFVALIVSISTAEPPETGIPCTEGAEPVLLSYGQHATGCMINFAADLDSFSFLGSTGDSVIIVMQGHQNDLDCRIELFNGDGVKIAENLCSASQFGKCSTSVSAVLSSTLSPATYTILVSDSGSNNFGSYGLQLEKVPPSLPEQMLFHNSGVISSLHAGHDIDIYRVEAVANELMRLVVAGTSNDLDMRVQLIGPDGAVVFDKACSASQFGTCSFSIDANATMTGTHHLVVFDNGYNNFGGYNISLQCIFGNCLCPERDTNGDHEVNVTDLLSLLGQWGACSEPCINGCIDEPDTCTVDNNRDCEVNVTDLLALLASWGACN